MNKLFGTVAALWLVGAPFAMAQDAAPEATAAPVETAAQAPAAARLTAEQIDQLTGPVALYPDPLLAQILIAAAYPLDVVQAARWVEANKDKKLTAEATEAALKDKPWDPSVKVLVGFPSVLRQLDQNLEWTTALGDAFVNQQADVMESIQVLRAQAKAAGHLESGKEQTVTVTVDNNITIEPTDPQKIYVPQYTAAVYEAAPAAAAPAAAAPQAGGTTVVAPEGSTVVTQGTTTVVTTPAAPAPYPADYSSGYYSGYSSAYPSYYSGGDVVASGLIGFGTGMLVGSLLWNNNNIDWNDHHVYHYGHGDYGWGGNNCKNCGNRNSNNNINIGEVNINGGNRVNAGNTINNADRRPWQPDQNRRPTQMPAATGATTRPAATAGGRGYGTGAGATAKPTAASVQAALGQGGGGAMNPGRGQDARRDGDRGRQSLQNSPARPTQTVPGNAGRPQGGNLQQPAVRPNNQPNAGRPQAGAAQMPAARPAQTDAGRGQGGNRAANQGGGGNRAANQGGGGNRNFGDAGGGNRNGGGGNRNAGSGGGTPSAFAVGNGNSDRNASQRGQNSRQSAAQHGGGQRQKPQGGGQMQRPPKRGK